MKLYILNEDQAKMGFMDRVFWAEHGLSILIDAEIKILFDLGVTDVYLRNAQLFDIDILDSHYVVVSHGHWDHTNGLKYFQPAEDSITLVAHPDIFTDRYNYLNKYNGVSDDFKKSMTRFNTNFTKSPFHITKDIVFLGEIPRANDFESIRTNFHYIQNDKIYPDFITDDSAMAIRTLKGLVIISGCSHAGICNIIEYARTVTNMDKVHMVIGGFHLLGNKHQLNNTIKYLKKINIDVLCPMHCINLKSLCKLSESFNLKKYCAGDLIEI